jgi:hypothetical protein
MSGYMSGTIAGFAAATGLQGKLASLSTDRPPGGLGSPLILIVLIPSLIVLRLCVRRGFAVARTIYAGYAGLRVVLIVATGPYNAHAAAFILLYAASVVLLFTPTANRWFSRGLDE